MTYSGVMNVEYYSRQYLYYAKQTTVIYVLVVSLLFGAAVFVSLSRAFPSIPPVEASLTYSVK